MYMKGKQSGNFKTMELFVLFSECDYGAESCFHT